MRIGVAEVDITPPVGGPMAGYAARTRGSEGVADPLYARALAIEVGQERAALITADLIGFPRPLVEQVRQQAHAHLGLAPESLLLNASHTHFGPILRRGFFQEETAPSEPDPLYLEMLQRQLLSVLQLAFQRLEEAHLGWSSVEAGGFIYNRRPKLEGKTVMAFRYPEDPERYSWGPVDPELQVLAFYRPSGEPIALVVNYGCHPVTGVDEAHFYQISADYPGVMVATLRRVLGVPVLFLLAPCGEIVPRWRGPQGRQRLGLGLAGAALKAYALAEPKPIEGFSVQRLEIHLPLKPSLASREAAQAALEAARRAKDQEALLRARRILWWLDEMGGARSTYPTELQAFAWDGIALLGLPGEVFAEIGLNLKLRSPIENTLVAELCNDSCGYIPTDAAFDEGGYEPEWTPLARGVGTLILENGLRLLGSLHAHLRR